MGIMDRLLRRPKKSPRTATKPAVELSPDTEGISEEGLAHWRELVGHEPASETVREEWSALHKTFFVYRGRGLDDARAWGRAVEDLADRYPEGYAKHLEARRKEGPTAGEGARASSRPTMSRPEADDVVQGLPGRIALLNGDESLPLRVTRAALLGSYLNEPRRRRLPDIDVAVEFEPRDPAEVASWDAVKAGIEKFVLAPRRVPGNPRGVLSDQETSWLAAKDACFSFLKGLSENLDVVDLSWVEENRLPHQIIYP